MTLKQMQRAGRLQEKGCLEYGEDDSWLTVRSNNKRPLASQEVSFCYERRSIPMRNSLVQPEFICRRKRLGRKNHKKQRLQIIPSHICMGNKNNCVLDYILDSKKKGLQIRQGSVRNL